MKTAPVDWVGAKSLTTTPADAHEESLRSAPGAAAVGHGLGDTIPPLPDDLEATMWVALARQG